MKEADVKEAVKRHLKSIGAYWFMPVQMGYGAATIDFFVCWQGRFYGIETKAPPKTLKRNGERRRGVGATPRQETVLLAIEAAGGQVCVEDDPELPLVKEMLK